VIAGILAATFEPPSTEDFVFGCWGPGLRVGGFDLCFNFIAALVVLTTIIVLVLFFVAFRKPKVVPGKFQLLMELGVQFVQENIAEPMLGNKATAFLPLLASFFFFILIGNLFEVVPGSTSPRAAGWRSRSRWRWSRGSPTTSWASASMGSSATSGTRRSSRRLPRSCATGC